MEKITTKSKLRVQFSDEVETSTTYSNDVSKTKGDSEYSCYHLKIFLNTEAIIQISNIFQEYDRALEDESEEREKEIENAIEDLKIIVSDIDPGDLKCIRFSDYHTMLDILKEDEHPVCDFGIYVSGINQTDDDNGIGGRELDCNIRVGDIVICVEDEDVTAKTSAQLKHILASRKENKKIQFILGRK